MPQPLRRRHALSAILLGLLAFAWLAAAPSAHAATITVTTTADELNRNGRCSLREAIRAANQNMRVDSCTAGGSGSDTITLPAGTYTLSIAGGDDAGALGDLDITGRLTINGAGTATTIVDANAIHRIFDVRPNATVALNQLGVRNGFPGPGADGGAIINSGTLTLTNSQVSTSRVEGTERGSNGNGGGIWSAGTLTLKQSTVSDNQANNFADDARFSGSGGGIFSTGSLTLERSIVSGNRTDGDIEDAYGGGIYTRGTATIVESTINGNRAYSLGGGYGGGIFSDSATLNVEHSTISNNVATYDLYFSVGGGIHTATGYFAPGSDKTTTITNTTISGNVAVVGAGIRHGSDGPLYLRSSTVAGNRILFGDDGPGAGAVGSGAGSFNIRNTIIAGNTYFDGGAPDDCYGTLTSEGYNLIQTPDNCTITGTTTGNLLGVDARLSPLQNNGGPTLTHLLRYGSPAIDNADPAAPGSGGTACPAQDQRSFARPLDGNRDGTSRCDIGALESRAD